VIQGVKLASAFVGFPRVSSHQIAYIIRGRSIASFVSSRPRSHQIEDQSRIAFERHLPRQWVYRRIHPDYGIDGSVEIFDDRGCHTGKQFNVQLKATDKPDLTRALAVRLSIKTCEYYCSLDVPVLIARFHPPTDKLFVRWFHEFDPYYGRRGKRTKTFRLTESDEWSSNTPSTLSLDLERIRRLRSGELPAPTPFSLHFRGDLIQGLSVAELSLNLRKALQTVPSVLSLITDATSAYGSISISNDDVLVNLAGLKHFTLHFRKSYGTDFAKNVLHHDVLLAVALTLDSAGLSDRAAKLVAEFAIRSSLVTNPEIAVRMARCMARAHCVGEALHLAEALLIDRSSRSTAHRLMVSMLAKVDVMSQDERELMKRFLIRYVEVEESNKNKIAAAVANYNLGNYLRSLSCYGAALRCYRKAATLDQRYLERGYLYREMAGVLFLMKRYRIAAKFYDRALRLGEKGITRALLADALMFSGRFSDSLESYEAYLEGNREPKPEFLLKAWALKELQRMLKVDEQGRQESAALQLALPESRMPNADLVVRLEKALRLDALCGPAWFNLGKCFVREAKVEDACVAFLWASLAQPKDAEAWANAFTFSAFSAKYSFLAPHIAQAARFASGESFIEQILNIAESQPAGFPKLTFLTAVHDVLTHVHKEERPFELRLLDKTGNVKVFRLTGRDKSA